MEAEMIGSNAASWTQQMIRLSALQDENESLRMHNAALIEQNGLLKASLSACNDTRLLAFKELARLQRRTGV
jgi:hypothetical protein